MTQSPQLERAVQAWAHWRGKIPLAPAVSGAAMLAAAVWLAWMDFFAPMQAARAPGVTVPVPPGLEYNFKSVAQGRMHAPRLFFDAMPEAALGEPDTAKRKTLFFKVVLPLVLAVNADTRRDREILLALRSRTGGGGVLTADEDRWLGAAAARYGLDEPDFKTLLRRADAVPPSLALAQAAKESGWGRSRFARKGNALFGQWTVRDDDDGIVPEDREDGARHRVKSFRSLRASVAAYMKNLNTHNAYREFRDTRAKLRAAGKPLSGSVLAGALTRYSELGVEYTERIKAMIKTNNLAGLDKARLTPPLTPAPAG
ncbi:MAG: glucosaminidase domain-containing protein [Rhodospirillales bacterium]